MAVSRSPLRMPSFSPSWTAAAAVWACAAKVRLLMSLTVVAEPTSPVRTIVEA